MMAAPLRPPFQVVASVVVRDAARLRPRRVGGVPPVPGTVEEGELARVRELPKVVLPGSEAA